MLLLEGQLKTEMSGRQVYYGNSDPDTVHNFAFVKAQQNYARTSQSGGYSNPAVPGLLRQVGLLLPWSWARFVGAAAMPTVEQRWHLQEETTQLVWT